MRNFLLLGLALVLGFVTTNAFAQNVGIATKMQMEPGIGSAVVLKCTNPPSGATPPNTCPVRIHMAGNPPTVVTDSVPKDGVIAPGSNHTVICTGCTPV